MTPLDALVLARCLGFVFRAPGFAHPSVSAPVRATLAYALALACAHARHQLPGLSWTVVVPALFVELGLGAAIGIAAAALYDGAYCGGRVIDDYVGIRISVPTAGVVAGAGFGRLWSLGFAAMFFALGGHRIALHAFDETFSTLPPGTFAGVGLAAFATAVPGTVVRAALLVAAPAVGLALAAQVALAAIGRIVPRFGTFPLSFPIVLACALLTTLAAFPAVLLVAGRPWLDLSPLIGR